MASQNRPPFPRLDSRSWLNRKLRGCKKITSGFDDPYRQGQWMAYSAAKNGGEGTHPCQLRQSTVASVVRADGVKRTANANSIIR